jgi:histidinol-phosphatase
LFCYESPAWFSKNNLDRVFTALNQQTALQRGICDAYGHMLVASGRAELVVEPQLSVWDVAATSLVVNEAGGRFSDVRGSPSIRSGNAVVTNGQVHAEALQLLQRFS